MVRADGARFVTRPLGRNVVDGIVTLTLDVPDKRNALSASLRQMLLDTLIRDEADPDVRAIILAGANNCFCSGGDINLMGEGGPDERRARLAILHDVMRLLISGRKPVIAAVSGAAFGGGFSLAMAADFVICDTTARFCASFGRIGLIADMGLLFSLPQRIGPARTRQLLMDGRVLDAKAALDLGIADQLVEPEELEQTARKSALRASSMAPLATAETKSFLAGGPYGLESILGREMDVQMKLFASEDHSNASAAFLEKKEPRFHGR